MNNRIRSSNLVWTRKRPTVSLPWLRLAALAHDIPELIQVGIIVVETPDKAHDGVGGTPLWVGGVRYFQVWLVRPGIQHCQAHTAAFFEAMLHLRDSMHRSPGRLITGATLHPPATGKVCR